MTKAMAEAIEDIAHRHQMGLFDIDVKNLANELEAAGFGLVADAGAKALEDAADDFGDTYHGNWLRARAAAVRGEG